MPLEQDLIWQPELLRVTFFLSELTADVGDTWWEEVVGRQPEQSTIRRGTGEHFDQGPVGAGTLSLARNIPAKRVDWIWQATPSVADRIPSVGPLEIARGTFLDIINTWLSSTTLPVVRVALGAILMAEVHGPKSGYASLKKALPMITFDDEWSDLAFQVNTPKYLSLLDGTPIAGLKVNCLSKWNAVALNFVPLDPTMEPLAPSHAVRTELDLNTTGDNKLPLSRDVLPRLVESFFDMAVGIAEKGLSKQ
jgi:hypothetical protein